MTRYESSLLIDLRFKLPLDIKFPILIDDTNMIIKEKIFASNYLYHPSFLKLSYEQVNSLILHNLEIDVIYLFDYIKENFSIVYDIGVDNFLLQLKNEGFTDLTKDSLLYSIKYLSEELEAPLLLNEPIDMNSEILKNESLLLYEKYMKIYNNPLIRKFYEIGKKFDSSFIKDPIYTDIKLIIKGDNVESGVNGNFIKLQEIFNNIELSSNIPIVILNKKASSQQYNAPLIKIYDKLLEENEGTLKEDEIKKWIINEKKYNNQSSFKIIKGLLLKLKIKISNVFSYLTVNILSNGIILVNFSESQSEINISIQDLLLLIYSNVNNLINKLNSLNGVFLRSKHLSLIDINEDKSIIPNNVHIISLDTITNINKFFDKSKFTSIINNIFISENIILGKNTKSENISSLLYTKINRNNTEKVGITINITHTEFDETNSTTVKILGAENYNQTFIILYIINILLDLQKTKKDSFFSSNIVKKKIKTTKKKAKELNINYDSKKCQSGRQPIVDLDNYTPIFKKTDQIIDLPNNLPKLKSYVLNYKNKQFKCDANLSSKFKDIKLKEDELNKLLKSPGDIYPGFTVDGIICCFSKNQESDEVFIKHINPESLYINIKPSNYRIKINDHYSTFALYIPPPNNFSGYYYLSEKVPIKLVKITNKNIILKLDNIEKGGKKIWLDEITLSKIIYPSSKEECNIQPNLNNRLSPCEHHALFPYFGYSAKSLPCCFESERLQFITKQKKYGNVKSNYIITNPNRVLSKEDQRGILPNNINSILTYYYPESNFYRIGFNQHPASFINAVLLSIKNEQNFKNFIDFKKNIISYLTNDIFKQLNNGDLLLKYKTLDVFLNKLNNNLLDENELINLLESFTKYNIIILDNTNSDKNIKISCRNSIRFNYYNRTIILFKHKSFEYELIISISKEKDSEEIQIDDINYLFNSESLLIKFFIKYLEKSCIVKNNYPENWNFIELLDSTTILQTKLQGKWKLKYQLVNTFNKVNLLVTENNFIIPIKESGILSKDNNILPQKQINYYIDNPSELLTLKQYEKYLQEFNKIFLQNCYIESIVDSKYNNIGGIITNYGYIIPYFKENKEEGNFKKESFYYYPEIDYVLNDIQDDSYININSNYENYKFLQYNLKNNIYNVKVILGKLIKSSPNSELRDYIYETIKSTEIPRIKKINIILEIFYQFRDFWNSLIKVDLLSMLFTNDNVYIINLSKSKISFIFHYIIQEMLDDNIENLLLNNIITSDIIKQNEIIKRNNESLLIGIVDIKQWLINHKKQPLIQEQLYYPSNFAS